MWVTKTLDPTAPNPLPHFETHCQPTNQKVFPPQVKSVIELSSDERFGLDLHSSLDIRRIYATEIVSVATKAALTG